MLEVIKPFFIRCITYDSKNVCQMNIKTYLSENLSRKVKRRNLQETLEWNEYLDI